MLKHKHFITRIVKVISFWNFFKVRTLLLFENVCHSYGITEYMKKNSRNHRFRSLLLVSIGITVIHESS